MTKLAAARFLFLIAAATLVGGCSRTYLGPIFGTGGAPSTSCQSNADCPAGETCDPTTHQCVPVPGGCTSDQDCSAPTPHCRLDTHTCVECTTSSQCPSGEECSDFQCVGFCGGGQACTGGLTCCSPLCVDTKTNLENCGQCGLACGPFAHASAICAGATCGIGACLPPFANCDGVVQNGCEVDIALDPKNCGGCGIACAAMETCSGGVCAGGCGPGGACPGTEQCCGVSCANTVADPNNCGGCGIVCPQMVANGTAACAASTCKIASCATGFADCDGKVGDGCEVDTANDPTNCGFCGDVCPAGSPCVSGVCQPITCQTAGCPGAQSCCGTTCVDESTDPKNCGGCGKACPAGDTCVAGTCQAPATCNGGPACTAPQTCCPAGCVDESTDPNNCGGCGKVCPATVSCTGGACGQSEGAFNPMVNPTFLSPGVHNFTTINIPADVMVFVAGTGPASGTLDLHATGPIVVNGSINLSGGMGTQNMISSTNTNDGTAGGGGFTGEPYMSAQASAACQFVAGNPGQLGAQTQGSAGSCMVLATNTCVPNMPLVFTAPVAASGGGAGIFTGFRAYGSGGGGPAGGAPGALCAAFPGETDCGGVSGGGGAVKGQGGQAGLAVYNGTAGTSGQTQCPGLMTGVPPACVGGGGGGSIGTQAAADLAVLTTFQTGSGGGGGSADYLDRPVFGGTSGGGGGGGALRLATPATITIGGQLLVNGGSGEGANIGSMAPNCDPQPGAAGGGGSGGVIYLSAPSITVTGSAVLSAAGGLGGVGSEFATGGAGGNGGLGRIRLSVSTATCSLGGSFNPPLAGGCAPVAQPGRTFIGVYPN